MGAASFTFLRTAFAKYGVSNKDLKKALLPDMEHIKDSLEQLKQKDLVAACRYLKRGLQLLPTSQIDRRETSEADRLFSLAERSATYAMSINNAGTDPEIKIEAIRIGMTSTIQRRMLGKLSGRNARQLCLDWLSSIDTDAQMEDIRQMILDQVLGVPISGFFFRRRALTRQAAPSQRQVKDAILLLRIAITAVAMFKFFQQTGTNEAALQQMIDESAVSFEKHQLTPQSLRELETPTARHKVRIDWAFLLLDLTDFVLDWEVQDSNMKLKLSAACDGGSGGDPFFFQRSLSSIGDLVSFAASASRAHVSPYRQRARENNQELVQQLDAFLFVAARADAREPVVETFAIEDRVEIVEIVKVGSENDNHDDGWALIRKYSNTACPSCHAPHGVGSGDWVQRGTLSEVPPETKSTETTSSTRRKIWLPFSFFLFFFIVLVMTYMLRAPEPPKEESSWFLMWKNWQNLVVDFVWALVTSI